MDEEKEKMKTGKKLVIALIMILLILTAGAYGYGVHYFTDHFLPGSQVNGFNCSYKTADETEKLLLVRLISSISSSKLLIYSAAESTS